MLTNKTFLIKSYESSKEIKIKYNAIDPKILTVSPLEYWFPKFNAPEKRTMNRKSITEKTVEFIGKIFLW